MSTHAGTTTTAKGKRAQAEQSKTGKNKKASPLQKTSKKPTPGSRKKADAQPKIDLMDEIELDILGDDTVSDFGS